jgi:hypothetical protein
MVVTASRLRENIYKLLDEVLETGEPLEIERKGKRLRIVVVEADGERKPSKLANAIRRDALVGDPEDIVHMDWSVYWSPDDNE